MYDIIVVDPPWEMKKIERNCRPNQTGFDYSTLTARQIARMKISSIAAENSSLFLWTTQKYLPLAFGIIASWGFRYHLCLTWDKGNGMCMAGFHRRTEFALFGYRGNLEMFPRRKAIPAVFTAKSPFHSAKPDEFYDLVTPMGASRIDIFARKERPGWDVWGNEVNGVNIDLLEVE